jgi:hypothetical protein
LESRLYSRIYWADDARLNEQEKTRNSAGPFEHLGASKRPNLDDPRVVLSLLEADQVVAEKRQTRFGRRNLSVGLRVLLWTLRGYVVLMLVIVIIDVLRAVHLNP